MCHIICIHSLTRVFAVYYCTNIQNSVLGTVGDNQRITRTNRILVTLSERLQSAGHFPGHFCLEVFTATARGWYYY